MKKVQFFTLMMFFGFSAYQLKAQHSNCYCYYNADNDYTEWLYFMSDSVVVIGQKAKRCEELDLEGALGWAREANNIWKYEEYEEKLKFTKLLIDPKSHIKFADYFYICSKSGDNLQVHIDYSRGFTDAMGPPDRIYRKIDL